MKKNEYDFVFVSHLPSFYKTNLFNEIAKHVRVFTIYLGETSCERTADFVKGKRQFDCVFLNYGDFEKRSRWVSSIRLLCILLRLNYRLISVGGWDLPESWLTIFISPKRKNLISQESSIYESQLSGWKLLLKRIFAKRLEIALVSGEPHRRLMEAVGFNGKTVVTGGVGLANRLKIEQVKKTFRYRFLYVGRLSREKNLDLLLRVFALPEMAKYYLTLAGQGPDRIALQTLAGSNVSFIGHIPNERIQDIYTSHDVFILPSLSEPWGLVIEEALYYGLPVLASSKVGSVENLVLAYGAGLSFDPLSEKSLQEAMAMIIDQYEKYSLAARSIDFLKRDEEQIRIYINSINEILPR